MDVCLPNGGHEYVVGNEACIYCGEPFPIIAREYGANLMPQRVDDRVWVPNGTTSASGYNNVLQVDQSTDLRFSEVQDADLVIVGEEIIKNRYGPEGKVRTLQSFFSP